MLQDRITKISRTFERVRSFEKEQNAYRLDIYINNYILKL